MSETGADTGPSAQKQGDIGSLFRVTGRFIGWLSGSLAAITGVFYALGYLVTLSNLHSLGLSFYLFDFDPSLYLTRGANLVLYFTRSISLTLFFLIILISPFVLLAFLPYGSWLKGRSPGWGRALVNFLRQHPIVWKGPFFAVLAGVLFFHAWPKYEEFSDILGISHILFDAQGPELSPEIEMVRNAILNRDPEIAGATDRVFYNSQLFLIEAAVLLYLAWRVTAAWRLRVLLMTPFVLVFAMFVVTIPMIFGIVVLSNKFPSIRVTTVTQSEVSRSDELYLLSKTDGEFILWDDGKREILWLPASSVTRAEIGRSKSLPARRQ